MSSMCICPERRRDRKRGRSCDPILTDTKVPDCYVPLRSERPQPFTGVFWDLEDCSIPEDLVNDSVSFYQNIKSALASTSYRGKMSTWAFVEKNTLSDKLRSDLADAGINFSPEVPEGKDARVNRVLLYDILLWAVDNPVHLGKPTRANLVVITNNIEEETALIQAIYALQARGYYVLLVHSDEIRPNASGWLYYAGSKFYVQEFYLMQVQDGYFMEDQDLTYFCF